MKARAPAFLPPRRRSCPERPRLALATLAVLAALGACGGDGESDTPPAVTETALDAFCAEAARARCVAAAACGFVDPSFESECEAWHTEVLCAPLVRALTRAEAAGELTWLPTAGRRCVEALEAPGCALGLQYDLLAVPECARAIAPRAADGASCTFTQGCLEGSFCAFSGMCPGTCRPVAGLNEPCDAATPCVDGAFCPVTAMRCQAQSDLGATCEPLAFQSSCRPGAFCDTSQPGQGACVAGRGRGLGCTRNAECADGLRCVANRCSGGQTGDTCVDDVGCVGEGRCAGGSCVEAQGEGSACASDANCARGLRCGGQCVAGASEGESCSTDTPCASGRCVEGSCRALVPDGGACGANADCQVGRQCIESACQVVAGYCPPL